jgi:hypothetical protein
MLFGRIVAVQQNVYLFTDHTKNHNLKTINNQLSSRNCRQNNIRFALKVNSDSGAIFLFRILSRNPTRILDRILDRIFVLGREKIIITKLAGVKNIFYFCQNPTIIYQTNGIMIWTNSLRAFQWIRKVMSIGFDNLKIMVNVPRECSPEEI